MLNVYEYKRIDDCRRWVLEGEGGGGGSLFFLGR